MSSGQGVKVVPIASYGDEIVARRTAKEMAGAIGFDPIAVEEIGVVVSELGTNLLKHAVRGHLELKVLNTLGRTGIQIESMDGGPGITDVEEAIRDGFSRKGSLGYGLGTVNRTMDEFDLTSELGKGTHIVCRHWLRVQSEPIHPFPLEFGAATRPHPRMVQNGDAFVIKRWGTSALVAVIDGLGHGEGAHQASRQAVHYIERHFNQALPNIFRGAGRACRATRGVVMALVRFDWEAPRGARESRSPNNEYHIRLSAATIGNIEMRICGGQERMKFLFRRGIVGKRAPNPLITEHLWNEDNLLILHSDGLRTHWNWQDFSHLTGKSATQSAQALLRALAKDNDDATVVVVKEKVRRC